MSGASPPAGGVPDPQSFAAGAPPELRDEICAAAAHPQRIFAGRYVLLAEVGRGGMGVVYKGWDPKLARLAAIKVVLGGPQTTATELARFQVEAKSAARLNHPSIVQVFDVGEVDGRPYIVMAFVDGQTLKTKLEQRHPLVEICGYAREIALALDYAHGHGVIHRDIKPSNIIVDGDGRAFLTDFGLARDETSEEGRLTTMGETLGTPMYMAPEQARGVTDEIGPSVDIYALGAVVYWAACRRAPFVAESSVEVMVKVATEPPPRPRDIDPEVPEDIEEIVLRCLEKSPADRYASGAELAEALGAFLEGQGAPGQSSTGSARFRRKAGSSRRIRGPSSSGRQAGGSGRIPTGSGRLAAGPSGRARRMSGRRAAAADGADEGAGRPAKMPLGVFIGAGLAIGLVVAVAFIILGRGGGTTGDVAVGGSEPEETSEALAIEIVTPARGAVLDPKAVRIAGRTVGGSAEQVWFGNLRIPVASDGSFETTLAGLEEGSRTIRITSQPEGGLELAGVDVELDATAPTVRITSPAAGDAIGAEAEVTGWIEDDHPDIVWIQGRDEVAVDADGGFRLAVRLDELPVNDDATAMIAVHARDRAGHESVATVAVSTDAEPPTLTLDRSPGETPLVTRDETVTIAGAVHDARPRGVLVDVDGDGEADREVAVEAGGRFEVALPLAASGGSSVELIAVDASGLRSAPTKLVFVRDVEAPEVVLTAPTDGAVTADATVRLVGRVTDLHRGPLFVGDVEIAVGDAGAFDHAFALADGANAITLRALDAAGNEAKVTVRVHRDVAGPAITLDPELPEETDERKILVVGRVDEDGCTVAIDGREVEVTERSFERTVTLKKMGPNEIAIAARDGSGNERTLTRTVVRVRKMSAKAIIPKGTWWKPTEAQKAFSAKLGLPVWFENELGMRFVLVPPDTFTMGDDSPGAPKHEVKITRGFYLGATEVTNGQFEKFDDDHDPSREFWSREFAGEEFPAFRVDQDDAVDFCDWLTKRSDGARTYRLPTEAEWELACVQGRMAELFAAMGAKAANVRDESLRDAWKRYDPGRARGPAFDGLRDGYATASPIGKFLPNAIGAFDVFGNVSEWTRDAWSDGSDKPAVDPIYRDDDARAWVARGGSWSSEPALVGRAVRDERDGDGIDLGFRVLMHLPDPKNKRR